MINNNSAHATMLQSSYFFLSIGISRAYTKKKNTRKKESKKKIIKKNSQKKMFRWEMPLQTAAITWRNIAHIILQYQMK